MATELDATTSIFKLFQDFVNILTNDPECPEFNFVSTTSLESAYQELSVSSSKIVVVQTSMKRKNNKFTEIEYALVPSFSGGDSIVDYNSLLMHSVNSRFSELHKLYSSFIVYEAAGLKQTPSMLIPTTSKLVVVKLEQDILGAEQLQNNFNSLKITFLGYLS